VLPTRPLTLLGYWATHHGDPSLIHPAVLPPCGRSEEARALLVRHLESGALAFEFLGMAHNRFADGPSDLGASELTDGVWIWPEGLAWYVANHDVPLPAQFVAHVERTPLRTKAPDPEHDLFDHPIDGEPWVRWCAAWREALGVVPAVSKRERWWPMARERADRGRAAMRELVRRRARFV
jgi:hypothetical protein